MLYIVQRQDCDEFAVAADLDPEYTRLLREAHSAGVRINAFSCRMDLNEIAIELNPLKLKW